MIKRYPTISDQLRANHPQLSVDLFRAKNGHDDDRESGTDSLALDIMRSRDHGLPGYVHYLNACRRGSHAEVAAWEQLEQRFRPKVRQGDRDDGDWQ